MSQNKSATKLSSRLILGILELVVFIGLLSYIQLTKNTEINNEISLSECFIEAPRIPYYPSTYTLGTIIDRNDIEELKKFVKENYPELFRIIECESNFDENVCNADYGCSSGMGWGQIIPGTLKYCEKKLGRKLDIFNAYDNLECSLWLYINEGTQHWGCETCNWGSWKCWHQ